MEDPSFVGREQVWSAALEALSRGGVVTLRGPPGVGKSTLARRLTLDALARGRRVVFVECDRAESRLERLLRIGAAAGLAIRSDDALAVFHHVATGLEGALLVLDGPSAAAGTSPALVEDLLLSTSELAVLVTGLTPLGSPLETLVDVPTLEPVVARRWLHARLEQLGVAALGDDALDELVGQTDGLPLALELLAAQVAALGVEVVRRTGVVRSSSLSSSIERALDGLDQPSRRALEVVSLFEGAFSPTLAARLLPPGEGLDALTRLERASLLQAQTGSGGARTLRLFDTVREVVRARSDLERARDVFTGALARDSTDASPEDLLVAWTWCGERPQPEAARWRLSLARALDPLLVTRGPPLLHRDLLERSLRDAPDVPVALDVLLALSRLDAIRGQHRRSVAASGEVLRRAHSPGDVARLGWAHAYQCYSLRPLGALSEARRHGEAAIALARELRDLALTTIAEQSLGQVCVAEDDLDGALRHQRRAVSAARLSGAPRLRGIAFGNLGATWLAKGAFDDAAACLRQGRDAFLEANDRFHLARLGVDEARLALAMGRSESEARLQEVLDAVTVAGALDGALLLREASVASARRVGALDLARERLDDLETLAALADDVGWPARLERLRASVSGAGPRRQLRLSRDGRTVRLDSLSLDFARRGPLRRVLLALVEAHRAGRSLTASEVQEAGWPGERLLPHSATARVYMAIRRLRALGLEPVLRTTDAGYHLTREVEVHWLEPSGV